MKRVKAICLGASDVGKTSLLTHMREKRFFNQSPTVGVDYSMFVHDHTHFQCWDVSGNPTFKAVADMFVKDCKVVVYVFDTSSKKSLDYVLQWHQTLMASNIYRQYFIIGNIFSTRKQMSHIHQKLDEYPMLMYFEVDGKNLRALESVFSNIITIADPFEPIVENTYHRRNCCNIN